MCDIISVLHVLSKPEVRKNRCRMKTDVIRIVQYISLTNIKIDTVGFSRDVTTQVLQVCEILKSRSGWMHALEPFTGRPLPWNILHIFMVTFNSVNSIV